MTHLVELGKYWAFIGCMFVLGGFVFMVGLMTVLAIVLIAIRKLSEWEVARQKRQAK